MVSRYLRCPWVSFKDQQPDSQNFAKQVKALEKDYGSWRDGKADGNCMYRAVCRSLLEHYCRPFTPLKQLQELYNKLHYQQLQINSDQIIYDYFVVLATLWKVMEVKRDNGDDLMKLVDSLITDETFIKAFIQVLRNLAYQSLLHFKPEGVYYEGVEEELATILNVSTVSGDSDLIGLSSALDADIVQWKLGRNDYQSEKTVYYSKQVGERKLTIHLGLQAGHYYIFYPFGLTKLEDEVNGDYQPQPVTQDTIKRYDDIAFPVREVKQ